MKKKSVLLTIAIIVIGCILIDIIASFYFYHLAIERGPKDFLQGNQDLEVSAETLEEFLDGDWITWTKQQPFEKVAMTAFDGITLYGYYLPAKKSTNKTVVFAHGYLGHAMDMGLFGEYYYEQLGYNIFMPDLRGHGQSEGDYIGFGWHDRLDIIDWLQLLIEKNGADTELVMHGLSMGAATVIMASGEKLPEQVKAIIADSPYTSVYDLFAYQMKRMYHLPDKPILPTTSVVTKYKADYSLREASALQQVEQATVPILYIHGERDTFVPTYMTEQLYERTKSESELVLFRDANHGEAIVLHRGDYLREITTFLEKNM